MRQSITVTTAASSLSLLTNTQLRALAGIPDSDTSRDTEINALGKRVSADIMTACQIASDGTHAPTLLEETIKEVHWLRCRQDMILLARRFVSSITSVAERDVIVVADDYAIDKEAGILERLCSTAPSLWLPGPVTIVYVAGFAAASLPDELVGAAMDLARLRLSADGADPLEKASTITIPDVETRRVERWVGAIPGSVSGPLPEDIMARLTRFVTTVVA